MVPGNDSARRVGEVNHVKTFEDIPRSDTHSKCLILPTALIAISLHKVHGTNKTPLLNVVGDIDIDIDKCITS